MSGFATVGYFLVTLFFSIVTFVLWVRLALCYTRVSSLHSIYRNIAALTDPIVNPISNRLPKKKHYRSRYDIGCFIVLILTEAIKFLVISYLFLTKMMPPILLVSYILGDLIVQPCNILF